MWREDVGVLNGIKGTGPVAGSEVELVQITGLSEELSEPRGEKSAPIVGRAAWKRRIPAPSKAENQESEITLCEVFSHLLSYPEQDYAGWVELCFEELKEKPAREALGVFAEAVRTEPLAALEERFVATFEMTKKRPLEIGWHLYGEQYKRGEFLVKMRNILRKHRVEESQELPDHLSHCLKLLPKMEDTDACSFLAEYLLPALEKLLRGFKDEDDPYRELLLALRQFLSLPVIAGSKGGEA